MQSLFPRLRQLFLPFFALPNDPAIIIGPDLPPCMQSRYSSAFFFRPPNTASDPLNRPLKYIGQVINPISEQVDEGFAIWDQSSICGYYVYKTTIAALAPSGSGNSIPQEIYNQIAQSGVSTMSQGGSTTFGGTQFGTGTGWTVNIGDGTAAPAKAGFSIDGVSQGRGLRSRVISNVNSAAVGAEAVVLTAPAMTFREGRAYRWECQNSVQASVANFFGSNIRVGSAVGAQVGGWGNIIPTAGPQPYWTQSGYFVRNVAAGDLVATLVQTLIASAGTVTHIGSAGIPRVFAIYDAGDASNFFGAPTI